MDEGLFAPDNEVFSTENPHRLCLGFTLFSGRNMTRSMELLFHGDNLLRAVVGVYELIFS